MESSVPPSAPGATSEVHGVKESGSKEGDSGSGSPGPIATSSSEKHVTFAHGKSERGQTESPSGVGDSAHSVETCGEIGCERVSDSETTSPASTDGDPTSGGPSSAEVVSLNGSAGGEHASEVSDRTRVDKSVHVGGVAGERDLCNSLLSWSRHKQPW